MTFLGCTARPTLKHQPLSSRPLLVVKLGLLRKATDSKFGFDVQKCPHRYLLIEAGPPGSFLVHLRPLLLSGSSSPAFARLNLFSVPQPQPGELLEAVVSQPCTMRVSVLKTLISS